jgi:hypothetical protein
MVGEFFVQLDIVVGQVNHGGVHSVLHQSFDGLLVFTGVAKWLNIEWVTLGCR